MGCEMADSNRAIEDEAMSDEKILLTVAEVSKLTGFNEGTLRHWISEGRIPFIRISLRCVRFRRSDIEEWLEGRLVPSIRDITQAREE